MILHPCLDQIAKRYADVDASMRSGSLNLPRAIATYAHVVKDNGLAMANLDSAVPSEADDGDGSIPFIISTFQEDRDGDVVIPRGCQLENYAKNPICFFGHQEWPVPIGKCKSPDGRITVFPEENRIRAVIYFDRADPDADLIYGKVKRGYLNATSIAFVPIEAVRRDDVEKARTRSQPGAPLGWLFKQYDLTEISVVGVPSNQDAIRDMLDSEKSFMSPRLQKAMRPFAAKARGSCFSGWCSSPNCPTETKEAPVAAKKPAAKKVAPAKPAAKKSCGCSSCKAGKACSCAKGTRDTAPKLPKWKSTQAQIEPMGQQPGQRTGNTPPKTTGNVPEEEKGVNVYQVTNIQGGRGRFAGCTDTAQMAAKLKPGERLVKNTYGGGTQIEVRGNSNPTGAQWDSGARGIIATAQIVESKSLGESDGTFGGYILEGSKLQEDGGKGPDLDLTSTQGYVSCEDCDGDGNCPDCKGKGDFAAQDGTSTECDECGGSGDCPTCGGVGQLPKPAKGLRTKGANATKIVIQSPKGGPKSGNPWVVYQADASGNAVSVQYSYGDEYGARSASTSNWLNGSKLPVERKQAKQAPPTTPPAAAAPSAAAPAAPMVDPGQDNLAKLYAHAKAELDFIDAQDDEEKATLADYREQVGQRMETLKARFGERFPDGDFDDAVGKAMESNGPQDTTEPGEAGMVENGDIPPETQQPKKPVPPAPNNGTKGANMARRKAAKETVQPGTATSVVGDDDAAGELDAGAAPYNSKGSVGDEIGEGDAPYNKDATGTGDSVDEGDAPYNKDSTGTGDSLDEPGGNQIHKDGFPPGADDDMPMADDTDMPPTMSKCPCGKALDPDANFCPGCGGPVDKAGDPAAGALDPPPDMDDSSPPDMVTDDSGSGGLTGDPAEGAVDTDADTQEILERYQGKDGRWVTRKWQVHDLLVPFMKTRKTKDGYLYLVRKGFSEADKRKHKPGCSCGSPDCIQLQASQAGVTWEQMAKSANPFVADDDDETKSDVTPSQGEVVVGAGQLKGLLARVTEVKDHLAAVYKAGDIPVHHKAGFKHGWNQLGHVSKALTDIGKFQANGGKGKVLSDAGHTQRDGGDGSPLSDKGEVQANGKKSIRGVDPKVRAEWVAMRKLFQQTTGIKLVGNN